MSLGPLFRLPVFKLNDPLIQFGHLSLFGPIPVTAVVQEPHGEPI